MLNFNPLDKTSYNDLRLQILAKVEENKGLSAKVYLDSKGIPTIGIGMNLRSDKPKQSVFTSILGDIKSLSPQAQAYEIGYRTRLTDIFKKSYPQTPTGEAQLQSDLNAVMAERSTDSRITFANKRTAFEFAGEQEIKDTFNTLADRVYEEIINTWYGSTIPDSYERLALLSLAYNSPSLLGSKLKTAIEEGNRPEAWYQIRYQTNGGESRGDGIAKRRYYESQIFSLYNDRDPNGVVTDAEARAIDKMQKANAPKIQDYDVLFEKNVANANRDYGSVALSGVKVQNLRESLVRSRSYITSQYFSGEDASKINQISFTESAKGVAVASALATDPLVVPLKVKSSATLRQSSVLKSNSRDQKLEILDENLDYADDDTSYYADDDVFEEDSQKVNSLLIGDSQKDIFYVDTSLLGSDHVVSTVSDGTIFIGSTKLSGNALPKTDSNDAKIEGVWQLSGFDFHKVGGDLVIVKSGADISKESVGKVTVKNFPFENSRGGFGITLGKKVDLSLGRDVVIKSFTNPRISAGTCLPTSDNKGFLSIMRYTDQYGNSLVTDNEIASFDTNADQTESHNLRDIFQSSVDQNLLTPAANGLVASGPVTYEYGEKQYHAFSVQESGYVGGISSYRVGAILLDADGKVLSSQIYVNTNDRQYLRSASSFGFYRSKDGSDDLYYSYTGQQGGGDIAIHMQKVNQATLEKVGNPLSYSASIWNDFGRYGTNPYQNILVSGLVHLTLEGDTIIDIVDQGKTIAVSKPILRDLYPREIISNRDLASGKQTTNPALKKQILSFTPDAETNLEILPNPNSVLEIFGRGDNSQVKMSFPVDHHSQIKIHSTSDADYTLEQLLNGEFDFSVSQELPISRPVLRKLFSAQEEDKILKDPRSDPKLVAAIWARNLGGEEEVNKLMKDSAESARLLRLDNLTNSTDDDYSYGYGDYFDDDDAASDVEEIDFNNLKTPITVIKLQLNETEGQTVILHGVNATEVAKLPEAYFLTQSQISNSPTSNPSKNPSGQPSSNPSSLLTNEPTNDPSQNPSSLPSGEPTSNPSHKPTAGELIMPSGSPTGQPTLQPFSDPSAIPSYRPQAIPSYNPTGKPTGNPTNNPSKDPTSNPSRNSRFPTNIPSYSKDTSDLPTSKPSMEELTNQPSSQPSNQATNQESNFPSLSFPSSQPSKQSPSNVPFVSASPSSDSPITTTLPPTIAGTNQDKDQNHQQTPSATLIGGVVGAVALVGLGIAATVKFLNRKGAPDNRKVYADEGINIDIEGNNRSGGNGR